MHPLSGICSSCLFGFCIFYVYVRIHVCVGGTHKSEVGVGSLPSLLSNLLIEAGSVS